MSDFDDIVNITIRQRAGELAELLKTSNALRDRLLANMPPRTPLTMMDLLRQHLQDCRDALRVMRGEASYIEWYDD